MHNVILIVLLIEYFPFILDDLFIHFFILLKVFEDTEFHQMEAEAHREAEREELNKEVRLKLLYLDG